MRNQKLKAIVSKPHRCQDGWVSSQVAVNIFNVSTQDERRVVYVGRIRRTMTQEELSERFSQFGEVECVSLHFRDRGWVCTVTFSPLKLLLHKRG